MGSHVSLLGRLPGDPRQVNDSQSYKATPSTPSNPLPPQQHPPPPATSRFHIFTKNARLNSAHKVATLLGELEHLTWDVLLLSEARTQTSVCELVGDHRLYTCLKDARGSGTGILIHSKHVGNIRQHHFVSDRVIAVDIRMRHRTIRFIAAYAPHAGYKIEDLQSFYDSLCFITSDARAKGYISILGGDFNTQLDVGLRGSLLNEYANAYDLSIANSAGSGYTSDSWTFCSSVGVKRRLDYIMASSGLQVVSCSPSNSIDMNSDHRAVHASFILESFRRNARRKRRRVQRGWKPILDNHGTPQAYHNDLHTQLCAHTPATLQSLEKLALTAAVASTPSKPTDTFIQPWQQPAVQELLQKTSRQQQQSREKRGSKTT